MFEIISRSYCHPILLNNNITAVSMVSDMPNPEQIV